jgi:hypothetical protein
MDARWVETIKLAEWAKRRLDRIKQFHEETKLNDKIVKGIQNTKLLQRIKHL